MSHARACTKVAYVTNEEIYWPISHKKPAAICITSGFKVSYESLARTGKGCRLLVL